MTKSEPKDKPGPAIVETVTNKIKLINSKSTRGMNLFVKRKYGGKKRKGAEGKKEDK